MRSSLLPFHPLPCTCQRSMARHFRRDPGKYRQNTCKKCRRLRLTVSIYRARPECEGKCEFGISKVWIPASLALFYSKTGTYGIRLSSFVAATPGGAHLPACLFGPIFLRCRLLQGAHTQQVLVVNPPIFARRQPCVFVPSCAIVNR